MKIHLRVDNNYNRLVLFDMGFFLIRQSLGGGGKGGGGEYEVPHHNFVVIAPMIMKFGKCITLDVFYTMVTKSAAVTQQKLWRT